MILLTFSITAALAGIAGCLTGLSYGLVSPYMAVSCAIISEPQHDPCSGTIHALRCLSDNRRYALY